MTRTKGKILAHCGFQRRPEPTVLGGDSYDEQVQHTQQYLFIEETLFLAQRGDLEVLLEVRSFVLTPTTVFNIYICMCVYVFFFLVST